MDGQRTTAPVFFCKSPHKRDVVLLPMFNCGYPRDAECQHALTLLNNVWKCERCDDSLHSPASGSSLKITVCENHECSNTFTGSLKRVANRVRQRPIIHKHDRYYEFDELMVIWRLIYGQGNRTLILFSV